MVNHPAKKDSQAVFSSFEPKKINSDEGLKLERRSNLIETYKEP